MNPSWFHPTKTPPKDFGLSWLTLVPRTAGPVCAPIEERPHTSFPRGEVLATLRGGSPYHLQGESLWNGLKSRFSPNQKKKLCNKYRTSRPTKNHITSHPSSSLWFLFFPSISMAIIKAPWSDPVLQKRHHVFHQCVGGISWWEQWAAEYPKKLVSGKRHITWFFLTWWLDNNYHKRIHMTLPL